MSIEPSSTKFCPAEYIDEIAPGLRAHPNDWIEGKESDGTVKLVTFDELPVIRVPVGGRVPFARHRQWPNVRVRVLAEGKFEIIGGAVPAEANQFYDDDWENGCETLGAFVEQEYESGNVEADGELVVRVFGWDDLEFELSEGGAKLEFEPVAVEQPAPEQSAPAALEARGDDTAFEAKVIIGADCLRLVLDRLAVVVERRNTIPILGNVLIDAHDGQISLTTTDLDQEMVASFAGLTNGRLKTTAPMRELQQFVQSSTGNVSIAKRGERVVVTDLGAQSNGRSLDIMGLPASDFPNPMKHKANVALSLQTDELREKMARVQHAISREETRYYLNGICFHSEGQDGVERLKLVATDGHRLALETMPWRPSGVHPGERTLTNAIVPRRTIATLIDGLQFASVFTVVEFGELKARFAWANGWASFVLTSKCIDGTYPPYAKVFPPAPDRSLVVEASELARALQAAEMLDNGGGGYVHLHLARERNEVRGSIHGDTLYADGLVAQYDGEAPLKIGFNRRYVQQLVQQLPKQIIRIELTDPSTPARVTAAGLPGAVFLLMPARIV